MLRFIPHHDERLETTEHLKDSTAKMVVVGYVFPAILLVIVAANLLLGRVVLPADRFNGDMLDGLVRSYAYGWQFAGIVTMKAGLAAALFSWYALANHQRTEPWAQPALLASIVVIMAGVGLYAAGFFI